MCVLSLVQCAAQHRHQTILMCSVFFVLGKVLEAPCTILKTKVFIMEVIRKSVAGHWPGGEAGAMLISHGGSFLAPLSPAPFLRTTAT